MVTITVMIFHTTIPTINKNPPLHNAAADLFMCLLFLDELLEHRQASLNHVIRDAGAGAEVIGATEIITGHDQQVFWNSLAFSMI